MSSSELTEKLQGDGCYKTNDCTVDVHSGDSHKVDAVHSENTKDMTEEYNHADNLLPSSPAVEESEKMVATEVLIEDKLDRGYSWVIVCASFVNCFIVGTMFIGFSILYVEITEFCGSSKGVAGGIGSLYMASGNTFGKKYQNSVFFYCLFFSIAVFVFVNYVDFKFFNTVAITVLEQRKRFCYCIIHRVKLEGRQ